MVRTGAETGDLTPNVSNVLNRGNLNQMRIIAHFHNLLKLAGQSGARYSTPNTTFRFAPQTLLGMSGLKKIVGLASEGRYEAADTAASLEVWPSESLSVFLCLIGSSKPRTPSDVHFFAFARFAGHSLRPVLFCSSSSTSSPLAASSGSLGSSSW